MTSRVFLLQRPAYLDPVQKEWIDKFDISPAAKFGEIIEILPPGNIADTQTTIRSIRDALRSFTEDDYLLLLGDPVAISLASCVAVQKAGGVLRLLKWDKRDEEYHVYVADFRYGNQLRVAYDNQG